MTVIMAATMMRMSSKMHILLRAAFWYLLAPVSSSLAWKVCDSAWSMLPAIVSATRRRCVSSSLPAARDRKRTDHLALLVQQPRNVALDLINGDQIGLDVADALFGLCDDGLIMRELVLQHERLLAPLLRRNQTGRVFG